MLKYYHNTTSSNLDNCLYAYLSADGDLLQKEYVEHTKNSDLAEKPKFEIIVAAGLLAICPIEEFERNITIAAREHFNIKIPEIF